MDIRTEQTLSAHPFVLEDDRVYPIPIIADVGGFSPWILRREIKAGRGPVVTRLWVGRIGIRGRHWRQWLDSRAVVSGAAA